MRFKFTLLSAMLLVALVSGVFTISNRVQQADKKIAVLQARITDEQENLRVLQAEWTFLNSPDRLEKLARTHFNLAPRDGAQYIKVAAIPTRAAMDEVTQLAQIEPGVAPAPVIMADKTATKPNALPPAMALPTTDISLTQQVTP